MKKLLRIALAVALCAVMVIGVALAADTDLGITSNGTITEQITNAPEGAKLVITVKYTRALDWQGNPGFAASNYGIGGLCINGGWEVDPDFTCTCGDFGQDANGVGNEVPLNTVETFSFDLDAVKKAATGDINLNIYNGFEIVKVVIRTADSGAAKTADTTTVVLFGAVAVVALVAVVASKKARA
jgi:hypothetical protein